MNTLRNARDAISYDLYCAATAAEDALKRMQSLPAEQAALAAHQIDTAIRLLNQADQNFSMSTRNVA